MRHLLIAALVAGISPAAARAPEPIPARWDRPYEGRLGVSYASLENVAATCTAMYRLFGSEPAGKGFLPTTAGCAYRAEDFSWCEVIVHKQPIWIVGEMEPYRPEETLRHEIAHCNGWPHTHPQDTTARLPRPRPKTPAEALTASVEVCYDTE